MFKAVQKSRQMAALQLSAHRCRAHYLSNVGNTELASDSGHVPTTGSVCKVYLSSGAHMGRLRLSICRADSNRILVKPS